MPIPARAQTFGLENCRDVLEKLDWEINNLERCDKQDALSQMHHAYNAAVTAWQLSDWVFLDLTDQQKAALGVRKLKDLQEIVRKMSRDVHLCRHIATASKHGIVEKFPDHTVAAAVSATDVPYEGDETNIFVTPTIWVLKINDAHTRHLAVDVFKRAHAFWTNFIFSHGIAI